MIALQQSKLYTATHAWLVIIELTLLSLLGRRAYRVCDDKAKVVPYPPLDEFGEVCCRFKFILNYDYCKFLKSFTEISS